MFLNLTIQPVLKPQILYYVILQTLWLMDPHVCFGTDFMPDVLPIQVCYWH